MKYIVGVDEVGRGPLAGPVTVCVVACDSKLYTKLKKDKNLPPLGKDSKKLSPTEREKYSHYLHSLMARTVLASPTGSPGGGLSFSIIHIPNKIIDAKGISYSIKKAIKEGIKKLKLNTEECEVLLDGGLKAPIEFKNQKTIIKGDEKEKIIAWASILAKVSRDNLMCRVSKKYPQYGFEVHKGYGTRKHYEAMKKHGLLDIHRKSFCNNI